MTDRARARARAQESRGTAIRGPDGRRRRARDTPAGRHRGPRGCRPRRLASSRAGRHPGSGEPGHVDAHGARARVGTPSRFFRERATRSTIRYVSRRVTHASFLVTPCVGGKRAASCPSVALAAHALFPKIRRRSRGAGACSSPPRAALVGGAGDPDNLARPGAVLRRAHRVGRRRRGRRRLRRARGRVLGARERRAGLSETALRACRPVAIPMPGDGEPERGRRGGILMYLMRKER